MPRFTSAATSEPFVTADGSTIREIAHPRATDAENLSLAEATVAPGEATTRHYHRATEEIYYFAAGRGLMLLGEEERAVKPGDCVVIPPGTAHAVRNSGEVELRFLCCCAPPYSDVDTVLLEK